MFCSVWVSIDPQRLQARPRGAEKKRMRRIAVLALLLLAALAPAAAHASTAAVEADALRVTAAPGEFNAVSVSAGPGTLLVADSGAPLAPGPGCSAVPGGLSCA